VRAYFVFIFLSILMLHIFLLENINVKSIDSIKKSFKEKIVKIMLNSATIEKRKVEKKKVIKKDIKAQKIENSEPIKELVEPYHEFITKVATPKPKIVKKFKKRTKKKRKRVAKHKKKIIKKRQIKKEIINYSQTESKIKPDNKYIKEVAKSNISKKDQVRYTTLIRELIRKNLFYPRVAKRMHIQGVVHISFVVKKGGDITAIKVLSSTSSILKRGAIKTIKSISPPPIPQSLGKSSLKLSIPIEFKLKE